MASTKSKILVIGGTGYIGKFLVEASVKAGHFTYVLVRDSTIIDNTEKAKVIHHFKIIGVRFAQGDLFDHESLVKAINEVDVVISAVGPALLGDQDRIIKAIKEAGNVKRFFPSEFGNDVDKVHAVEPAKTRNFGVKAKLRRKIEAENIPYTYIVCNFFAGFPNIDRIFGITSPPREKITLLGDGNTTAVFNKEEDIAEFTIRAVDDPRTLNKILYIKPPENIYSQNELVSLWEKKIGKTIERDCILEEQMLSKIQESPYPVDMILATGHSIFVKGDQTNFEIDPAMGVEATEIYPDVKYTTVDEYLNQFV